MALSRPRSEMRGFRSFTKAEPSEVTNRCSHTLILTDAHPRAAAGRNTQPGQVVEEAPALVLRTRQ